MSKRRKNMEQAKRKSNFSDEEFEMFVRRLNEWVERPKVYILDEERMKEVYVLQQKMQKILDEENIETEVRIKPAPLGMGSAVIEFDADYVVNRNPRGIISILNKFNNFEFVIRDGKIHFSGMIHKVAYVKVIE